jgi:uncharacterized LabA/DUF88 family protein
MVTNVYVDGFNLYYGSLKGTPYRWLDIHALCEYIFPNNDIKRARYFTAIVKARPQDPQQPVRQTTYLRALHTLSNLSIHEGEFYANTVRMPLAFPTPGGPTTVEVIKSEEKGSDVNLATWLLLDAFRKEYEAAIVISNDSDLAEPIVQVRREFGVKVVVLHPLRPVALPQKPHPNYKLVKSVILPEAALPHCQFPASLSDVHGHFAKPPGW